MQEGLEEREGASVESQGGGPGWRGWRSRGSDAAAAAQARHVAGGASVPAVGHNLETAHAALVGQHAPDANALPHKLSPYTLIDHADVEGAPTSYSPSK